MTEHQLVGYDPESEKPAFSIPISNTALHRINFPFGEDDPEGVFTFEIDYSKVSHLAGILREPTLPPKHLKYFIEPYP